jgi:hypothetical protein
MLVRMMIIAGVLFLGALGIAITATVRHNLPHSSVSLPVPFFGSLVRGLQQRVEDMVPMVCQLATPPPAEPKQKTRMEVVTPPPEPPKSNLRTRVR